MDRLNFKRIISKNLFYLGLVGYVSMSNCGNTPNNNQGHNNHLETGINISSKEECLDSNGVWQKWSRLDYLLEKESCNIKSDDMGRECFEDSDCEGFCLFIENQSKCSKFRRFYGCAKFFEKNEVYPMCFD